jgi:hypothetical protein
MQLSSATVRFVMQRRQHHQGHTLLSPLKRLTDSKEVPMRFLTPTIRIDPKAVRITEDEILADLHYPARVPARRVASSSRRHKRRP